MSQRARAQSIEVNGVMRMPFSISFGFLTARIKMQEINVQWERSSVESSESMQVHFHPFTRRKKNNTAHVILVSIALEIYTFGGILHNSILSQLTDKRMLTINWMQIEKMSSWRTSPKRRWHFYKWKIQNIVQMTRHSAFVIRWLRSGDLRFQFPWRVDYSPDNRKEKKRYEEKYSLIFIVDDFPSHHIAPDTRNTRWWISTSSGETVFFSPAQISSGAVAPGKSHRVHKIHRSALNNIT